jgi:hypothetical protein
VNRQTMIPPQLSDTGCHRYSISLKVVIIVVKKIDILILKRKKIILFLFSCLATKRMSDEFIIAINLIQVENKIKHEKWEGYEVVTNKDTIKVLMDKNHQCCELNDTFLLMEKDNVLFSKMKEEEVMKENFSVNKEIPIDKNGNVETTRTEIFSTDETSWTISKKEYLKHREVPWMELEDFVLPTPIDILLEVAQAGENVTYDGAIISGKELDVKKVTFNNGDILYTTSTAPIKMKTKNRRVEIVEEFKRTYDKNFLSLVRKRNSKGTDSATIKLTTNKGLLYLTCLNNHNGHYSHEILLQCSEFDYKVEV